MVSGSEPYPELDRLCIEILEVLEQHDGSARTPELRESTSADTRYKIHYRVDGTLEPQGFIEVKTPRQSEPGKIPAKHMILTDEGQAVLEDLDRDAGGPVSEEVVERVGALETQLNELQDQIAELQDQIEGGGVSVSDDDLQRQVTEVASDLNSLKESPLFEDDDIRSNLNGSIIMSAVSKQLLIKEFGEDRVRDLFTEMEESMSLLPMD